MKRILTIFGGLVSGVIALLGAGAALRWIYLFATASLALNSDEWIVGVFGVFFFLIGSSLVLEARKDLEIGIVKKDTMTFYNNLKRNTHLKTIEKIIESGRGEELLSQIIYSTVEDRFWNEVFDKVPIVCEFQEEE